MENNHDIQDIIVDLFSSLSAVKDLSELDSNAGSVEELIKNALSALIQNQDMERCSFFLYEKGTLVNVTGLSSSDSSTERQKTYKPLQFELGEGIIGLAAQTGKLQHCEDSQNDVRFSEPGQKSNRSLPGSIISVPVYASNKELIGVLNISHPHPFHFSEWHIHLLEIYKNMLGQLITNYRLFQNMEEQIAIRTNKLEQALDDLQLLKDHFESVSMIDQLTGLYNRHYFYDHVENAIANATRYDQSLCLLLLDLDLFKEVNDSFGHGYGDYVLKEVSLILQQQVRDSDILVRFGGEEFIIIFTNTNCRNGKVFAERIRKEIESLVWEGKDNFIQTMSIGLYCLDNSIDERDLTHSVSIDDLLFDVDKALYAAKKQGRNKVVVYSDTNEREGRESPVSH